VKSNDVMERGMAVAPRSQAKRELCRALNMLLADFFAVYIKYKNFHWHVSGSHFHCAGRSCAPASGFRPRYRCNANAMRR
jgi:hypothetical protein